MVSYTDEEEDQAPAALGTIPQKELAASTPPPPDEGAAPLGKITPSAAPAKMEPAAPTAAPAPVAAPAYAPGSTISSATGQMMPPGKQEYHQALHDFEKASAKNLADKMALDPTDPDYLKNLSALSAQSGQIKADRLAFEQLHPWGSPESAHPGTGGKIAHVLGRIGNIAGDVLAPGTMSLIPGTDLNRSTREHNALGEVGAANENALKAAQVGSLEAKAATPPKVTWKPVGTPVVDDTGNMWQVQSDEGTGEVRRVPVGGPAAQPSTAGTPAAPAAGAAAPTGVAGGTPTAGPAPTTGAPAGPKFTKLATPGAKEADQPVGAPGVTQHNNELGTLTEGMGKDEMAKFLKAYEVQPTDSLATATKRLEYAKSAAQMSGAERDRKITRDLAAQNRGQARTDAEQKELTAEVDKAHALITKNLDKANDQIEKLQVAGSEVGGNTEIGDALGVVKTLVATAGGQGSGVRVTDTELNRIIHGRGWEGTVSAFFEHAQGYGTLTPVQRTQIKDIIKDITKVMTDKRDKLANADESVLDAKSVPDIRAAQKKLNLDMRGGEPIKPEEYAHQANTAEGPIYSKDGTNWVDAQGNPYTGHK